MLGLFGPGKTGHTFWPNPPQSVVSEADCRFKLFVHPQLQYASIASGTGPADFCVRVHRCGTGMQTNMPRQHGQSDFSGRQRQTPPLMLIGRLLPLNATGPFDKLTAIARAACTPCLNDRPQRR